MWKPGDRSCLFYCSRFLCLELHLLILDWTFRALSTSACRRFVILSCRASCQPTFWPIPWNCLRWRLSTSRSFSTGHDWSTWNSNHCHSSGRLGARTCRSPVCNACPFISPDRRMQNGVDEVKEICRRAPRLSALSLVVGRLRMNCDCRFCLQNGFEKSLGWTQVLAGFHFKHTVFLLNIPLSCPTLLGWLVLDLVTLSTRFLSLFLFECNAISRIKSWKFLSYLFQWPVRARPLHGVIATIGGRLRRLKIKILELQWNLPAHHVGVVRCGRFGTNGIRNRISSWT